MASTTTCRLLLAVTTWTAAGLAHAAPLDLHSRLPGSDRPAAGRPLFDYLALSADGKRMDVPYPIEALVARIKERTGATPKVIMVPKGRSIERSRADYDAPRLVVAYDADGTQTAEDLGYAMKDRLYIGNAERGQQLEVISYNAAAGRYEFQLVTDYAPGKTPKVVYADRLLCTQCHQNGAPIFAPVPWFETNGVADTDHKVADLITNALGGQKSYHSFPVDVPRQIPYDIDNSTERANLVASYQLLWTDACGKDDSAAPLCRASVLKFALQRLLTPQAAFDRSSPEFQTLQATWTKYWQQNLGGGLIVPSPKILPFDPVEATEENQGFPDLQGSGLSSEQAQKIRIMLQDNKVPPEVDPLKQKAPALETWTMTSVCYGTCIVYGIGRFFTEADVAALAQASGNDFSRVAKAIDQLASAKDQIFGNRPFRRGITMRALLQQLGGPVAAARGENDYPKMPAPNFDHPEQQLVSDGSPLNLMRAYCLPCHKEFSGRLGFLDGNNDAEITAKIKLEAKEIVTRLNWEQPPTPGHKFMPPDNDADANSQRSRLKAAPADRQKILDFVKSL